jgi:D-alanyl-D-alanine carboxypeptidase
MDAEGIVDVGAVGAITYVDGEVAVAGFANLETQERFTMQHRFRVGSIDKTFIAVVAVSVLDDLDAAAASWLPQLDRRITLRHLLAHRSGLFDYMWDGETYERRAFGPPALSDPEAFLAAALRYPLRNFGEVSYSSSNYAALDLILERETGRPLGELIHAYVLEPFGLARTTFQNGLEAPPDVARGYALKHGMFPVASSPHDVSEYWADRSIASDVFDLASFLEQVLATYPELVDGRMGIRMQETPRGAVFGHGGTMAGYTTQVWATRDASRVIVVAANSHSLPVSAAVSATVAAGLL